MHRGSGSGSGSGKSDMSIDGLTRPKTPENHPGCLSLQHTPPKRREELDSDIKSFLDDCRLQMQKLVKEANHLPSLLPTWKGGHEDLAEHISKLGIPLISGGQPSLLLHDLGEEKDKLDRDRTERIPDIFSFANHRYVT
jgi:hypothetical protein